MEILLQIVLMVVGFVMLLKGADWFLEGAAGVATKLGIPQLVIGLTIVAMGTSAPEMAVSLSSALKGNASICVGNVLGSNILNILIILGLTSLVVTLKVAKSTVKYEIPFMIFITVLLMVFGYTGNQIALPEGAVLLVLFVLYLTYLFVMAKRNKETEEQDSVQKPVWMLLIWIAVGLVCIIVGSNFTVDSAVAIAQKIGISERFIGLTLVALGTSLPELVTSLTAAKKGNADIAIGNIVGSNIFNILFIIGVTAFIIPVEYASNFMVDTAIAIGAGVLLFLGAVKNNSLGKKAGIVMLLGYAAYFVYLLV